jgi:phosphatidylglycerophosphatase A
VRALTTFIGSFFYCGFFPVAPATFASFVFLALYGWLQGGEWLAHPLVAGLTLLVSVPIATSMERRYGHDAGKIVIDEVVGLQVVLVLAAPTRPIGIVATFLLFRFFDILKPYPAGWSQQLPRGWGVVADDFIAGIYTRIVLIIVSLLWSGIGTFL